MPRPLSNGCLVPEILPSVMDARRDEVTRSSQAIELRNVNLPAQPKIDRFNTEILSIVI